MLSPATLMYDINLRVCDAILAQEYIVHNFFSLPPPLWCIPLRFAAPESGQELVGMEDVSMWWLSGLCSNLALFSEVQKGVSVGATL